MVTTAGATVRAARTMAVVRLAVTCAEGSASPGKAGEVAGGDPPEACSPKPVAFARYARRTPAPSAAASSRVTSGASSTLGVTLHPFRERTIPAARARNVNPGLHIVNCDLHVMMSGHHAVDSALEIPGQNSDHRCTVRISNEPGNEDASRLGVDSSSNTLIAHQCRRGARKQFDGLLSSDRRVVVEELVKGRRLQDAPSVSSPGPACR